MTFIKEKFLFRTKVITSISQEMIFLHSAQKELFALFVEFPWTVFAVFPLPWATFRIVPTETLPRAEL